MHGFHGSKLIDLCPGVHAATWCSNLAGTGQTVFLYDIMFEYSLRNHPILWHSWELPDTLYCFGPDGVREGSREAFKKELLDPDAMWVQHCAYVYAQHAATMNAVPDEAYSRCCQACMHAETCILRCCDAVARRICCFHYFRAQ